MKHLHISTQRALSRRHFLKGLGVALSLPMLDAMRPAFAQTDAIETPRRFFGICNNLGLLADRFFPAERQSGPGYTPSPYLEIIQAHRKDFTVFSGVSHPEVDGGHPADNCFLTAAPHPGSAGFRNTISLDQFAAQHIGHRTRFPTLTLGVNIQAGLRSLSWTSSGVMIPCEESAARVFRRLFLAGSPQEVDAQVSRLSLGRSIMDTLGDQVRRLQREVGAADRDRLDQFFTSVRDLERRMEQSAAWETKPKPKVTASVPVDPQNPGQYMDKVRLMYDLAALAFETDSTRLITLMLDSVNSPAIEIAGETTSDGYHNLSHHGQDPKKLEQLEIIDRAHLRELDHLFARLKNHREENARLLDHTMVLYGSNFGNASTHVTTNLPVVFAGGGFRHGQHLAFDRQRNEPLPRLFVSILQQLRIETDRFASGSGTMRGLEVS